MKSTPCYQKGQQIQIQNLQPKQQKHKKNLWIICHSSQWNYQKKLKRLKFSKMDEEHKHSPSKFYYPEDLEIFYVETETGITESQDAICI